MKVQKQSGKNLLGIYVEECKKKLCVLLQLLINPNFYWVEILLMVTTT